MEVTARDDIVSRAALVEPDLLPEPWGPEDEEALGELVNREIFRQVPLTDSTGKGRLPEFLIDYEHLPAIIPNALQSNHVRSSVATRWDKNGNLVEDSAGTLRLWRDPATQNVEGLIYEPKRTQLVGSDPTDPTTWRASNNVTFTTNAGAAKGKNYVRVEESNDSSALVHNFNAGVTSSDGVELAGSFIVRADGRNWVSCVLVITDGTNTNVPKAFFDLSNGATGNTSGLTNASVVDHSIDDLGGGWYRCNFVISPDAGWSAKFFELRLANGDGSDAYQGDGSSGILFLHGQEEISSEVTSPILQGGGVRDADEVNYGFSFPDKTTGVAYSILQESAGALDSLGYTNFGPTNTNGKAKEHGILMDGGGLNGVKSDGWKTVTRNSDDNDTDGHSPKDETVTRFEQQWPNGPASLDNPIRIVRQIAIHTAEHTSTQLSDLESNYLTTP